MLIIANCVLTRSQQRVHRINIHLWALFTWAVIFSKHKGWFVTSVLKAEGFEAAWRDLWAFLGVNSCCSPRKDVNDHSKPLGAFLGANKHQGVKGEMSA